MSTPLADLIRTHCDATGDTLADIAKRSGMSRQTLSALVNREEVSQMPRASTVQKLADGLGLPYDTVRRVVTESTYGSDDERESRRSVRVLLAYAERMPDRNVEVLLATARALEMATTPGPDDSDEPAPEPVAPNGTTKTRRKTTGRKTSAKGLSVIR